MAGTGLKVVSTDVPGLTLTAAAYDALASDQDKDGPLIGRIVEGNDGDKFNDAPGNLYYLGAAGNYDPVAFKIAIANVQEVATLYGAEAGVSFNVTDDVNLNLKGQYVHNQSDYDLVADANFWAIQAGTKLFGAKLNAGYLDFDAKNKDNNKYSFVSIESNGQLINPTKILNGVMNGGKQYYRKQRLLVC